jgi:YidC/Oxa1 family membrane protein insertase
MSQILTEPLRLVLLAAAQALGGNLGAAIIVVSAALRFLLMPLTIKLAERARAQQVILESLKPALALLQERYGTDQAELAKHTLELYRQAGYHPLDLGALAGNLAQLPVFVAMYGALRTLLKDGGRFLWVGNLAQPDTWLALIAVAITGIASYAGGHSLGQPPRAAITAAGIGAAIACIMFWHASAGLVLSWGASSATNLVQSAILTRRVRRA